MKPYYNIVLIAFQAAILRKLRQFFQDGVNHVSDNTEYNVQTEYHVLLQCCPQTAALRLEHNNLNFDSLTSYMSH